MQKILFMLVGFVLFGTSVPAQILKPVKWNFAATPVKGKAGMFEVRMTAVIEKGWHIYSQGTPDGGPSATKVTFAKNPMVLLGGKVTEDGKLHKEHSEVFGVDVLSFDGKVSFVQIVKLKKPGMKTSLSGKVSFMVCDATQCLPPETVEFIVELK